MIQCCLCAVRFHYECVGLKKNDEISAWPCLTCRMMPSQIRTLQQNVSQLMADNNELKQSLFTIQQLLQSSSICNNVKDTE